MSALIDVMPKLKPPVSVKVILDTVPDEDAGDITSALSTLSSWPELKCRHESL